MTKRQSASVVHLAAVPLPEKLLDVDQVAERLGVRRTMVFQLIRDKGLPCIQLGEKILKFHPDSLARWLAAQEQVG